MVWFMGRTALAPHILKARGPRHHGALLISFALEAKDARVGLRKGSMILSIYDDGGNFWKNKDSYLRLATFGTST